MARSRALVICDDTSRKEFLFSELKKAGLFPVWYPNIFAYRKAVSQDDIKVIIADLSMPIEPKLDIINRGAKKSPRPSLITIGKIEYLKTQKDLLGPHVKTLKHIQEISKELQEALI